MRTLPLASRSSLNKVFGLLLLAVLAAGLGLTPRPAVAQSAAPASSAETASSTPAQSGSPSGESHEQEEMKGFLESSTVRSIARVLHLNLTVTKFIFLAINFAVLFFALAIPLGRMLPKMLRKRSDALQHGIESARKLTQDANARLAAVEAQMAKLGDEIEKFRGQMEEELKADEARIKSAIEEESARIVAAAEQEIGAAAVQARRGLRRFAAELAIDHAAHQLVLTPETDRALIAEFAEGVTQNHAGLKGGQN